MGTGTSTLSAIESLSSSLQEIERKLAVLEDSHLHHEKTICFDDNVIVSGKRIQCRSGVRLVVGPVLGIVTTNGVRVLVEVDDDCELTMNFFAIDELNTDARFQREDRFIVKKHTPIARSFTGLVPNTKYALYIGGVNSSDTLLNYATFTTLPIDDSIVRVVCTHGSRIDRIFPGEINLMNTIDEVLCDTGVHLGYTSSKLFTELKTLEGKEGIGDVGIVPTGTRTTMSDSPVHSPVHLIVHNGDMLSVDDELRGKVMELIDIVVRDDICNDTWKSLLTELEESLKRKYRNVLNNPTVKNITRRCGNLFIAGQGESGMVTSSLLAMGPKQPEDEERDEESPEVAAGDVPTVGNQVRKSREKEVAQRDNKTILFEDLRQLLLGAIERLTRRVCWSYYRQLWDVNYDVLESEDTQREVLQRNILHTRKLLYVKTNMLNYLDRTRKKLLSQYDPEYTAHVQVVSRISVVREEITVLEGNVKQIIKEMAIFNNVVKERPNGACIDLGKLLLVFVETAWGWILPDGAMQVKLVNRDVAIHPDLIGQLEGYIAEGKGVAVDTVKKRAVAVITPFTFLPSDEQGENIPFNEPQMFGLSGMDRRTILRLCAKWQQSDTDRAVLLAGSCDGVAVAGWAFPTSILDQNNENNDENQVLAADGWDDKRSRMKHVLIGRMDKRSKGSSESKVIRVTPGFSPGSGIVSDESSSFSSEYDTMSVSIRRSYWDISLVAATPSVQKPSGKVIVGQPAYFHTRCITDARNHQIVVGPVIGQVTSTTANVLLEIAEDGHVELVCKDKVTGLEYYTSLLLKGRRPGVFRFDKLVPNHPYDVLLLSPCKLSDPVDSRITTSSPATQAAADQTVTFGSFTTASTPVNPVISQDKEVKLKLREQVHNKAAAAWTALATATPSSTPPACRVCIIGAVKPSWVRVLPQQDPDEVDNSRLGNERVYLGDGIKLSRALVDILSKSWSGVDLVLHCDYSVDIVATMSTVLTALSQAEELHTRSVISSKSPASEYINETVQHQQKEVASLLAYAEESLRNAYRIHWGCTASTKSLLAHGPHLFISSPMFDLLTAMNANSLRELQRDLSPFVCENLLHMLSRVNNDYQVSLWDRSGPAQPNPCKYLAHGKVGVFTLQPQLVLQQENFGSIVDNLIPEEQVTALINALHPEVDGDMLNVLLLVSPIPLLSHDMVYNDGSLLTNLQKGCGYTTKEALRILDILAEWLEDKSKNRHVIIIAGGVTVGRSTVIECELNDLYYYDPQPPEEGQDIPAKGTVTMQQICCGSLVGVPGDDVIRPTGVLSSAYRVFKYEHSRYISSAHCGLVDLIPQQNGGYSGQLDFLFMRQNQLFRGATGSELAYTPSAGLVGDYECDEVWKRVNQWVNGDYKSSDADQLVSAIRYCCEDSKAVIAAVHVLYREKNSFGMPSNGGIVVEEAFLAVNHWILTRMSSNYQRICPLPSTFVIRHLWLKFCVTEAPPLRSEAGFTDKEPLSSAEILAITMSTDLEIFTNFVCQLMEHQALLELFAFQMAQFD